MKLITWNCNGIRSRLKDGFWDFIDKYQPDILCLQEVKSSEATVPIQFDAMTRGYGFIWNHNHISPGTSGTAIFSNQNFEELTGKFLTKEEYHSGRIQIIRVNETIIVNVYSPQSGIQLVKLDHKLSFMEMLLRVLNALMKEYNYIVICGDLNIANESFREGNKSKGSMTAGFTKHEFDMYKKLMDLGFIDVLENEGFGASYEEDLFDKDHNHSHSWRLDHILLNYKNKPKSVHTFAIPNRYGSDHFPLGVEIQ